MPRRSLVDTLVVPSGTGSPSEPGASSEPAASSDPVILPATLAGRYRLLGLIGAGAMGSVYRARDAELDEDVALKILRGESMDAPGVLARFRQEVKLARRVTHHNVARIFDIGEHEGEHFLTMELVRGESLAALLRRRGALPPGEAIAVAGQICAGLSAAHAAGVVHRDLKPDNVLVSDERVVVTDFGVAFAHRDVRGDGGPQEGALTKPSAGAAATWEGAFGTPAYMAPEQVEAPDALDHRADIYALGEVMYEMLTGEPTWPAALGYAVVTARLTRSPPDPRARQPDVPDALAELVLACMARRREDRPRDAAAVAAALAAVTGVGSARPAVPPADLPSPDDRAVAVLRFKNLGAPDDDYLAAGLTEDLLDTLAMTRGIKVRAHAAAPGGDPGEIGRSLGVHVVVDGSVRRVGDRIRINARLVSVADGFHLWGHRFDRPLTDLLAVNDETVRAVADALSATHLAPNRDAPADLETMELYLRAMNYPTTAAQGGEVQLFEEALRRAPRDPVLLSAFAVFLARRSFTGGSGAATDIARAQKLAERAVEAAPHRGEPWVARAHACFSAADPAGAASAVHRALRAAPSLAGAHELAGRILLEVGLLAEGVAHLERAHWLDPSVKATLVDLTRGLHLLGEDARVQASLRAMEDDPAADMLSVLAYLRTILWTGERLHRPLPRPRDGHTIAFESFDLLLHLLATGEMTPEEVARHDAMLAAAPPGSRPRRMFLQLKVEQLLYAGRADEAEEALPHAVDEGLLDVAWMDCCPLLAPLRARPTFAAMRERVAQRAAPVAAAWRAG